MIAVVGGGIAGLVAARSLRSQGHEVTVLEAGETTGGMIRPITVGGITVDAGAEAYATRTHHVAQLCDELGLDVAPPATQSRVWWADRGTHQLASGIAGIPATWEDPAWGVLTSAEFARASHDRDPHTTPLPMPATLGELVRRHLGEAAERRIVAPVVRGIYGIEPDAMPVNRVAPGLAEALSRERSLVAAVDTLKAGRAALEQPLGGMHRLIAALDERLVADGVSIRTRTAVESVTHTSTGWILHAGDESLECSHWVAAVPGDVFRRIVAPLGIDLPAAPIRPTRTVITALDHPALADAPVGSGILLGDPDATLTTRSLTHYSAKWAWAPEAPQVVRLTWPAEAAVTTQALLPELSTLLGVDITAAHLIDMQDITWHLPRPLSNDHKAQVVRASASLGVPVVGAWYNGNGLAPVVAAAEEVQL